MRTGRARWAAWVALPAMAMAMAGCGGGAPPAAIEEAPEELRGIYRERCALCHGADGRGTPLSGPAADLGSPDWRLTVRRDELATLIENGRGKMLGFERVLTPEQIDALAGALVDGAALFERR